MPTAGPRKAGTVRDGDADALQIVQEYCQSPALGLRPPARLGYEWTDSSLARWHARQMAALGIERHELAARARIRPAWIRALCSGQPERALPPIPCIPRVIEHRILAVRLPGDAEPDLPSTLTRIGLGRRARALAFLGWPAEWIAAETAMSRETIAQLQAGSAADVGALPAALLCRLYEDLQMAAGPCRATENDARERGFIGPLGWDDTSIDGSGTSRIATAEEQFAQDARLDHEILERLIDHTAPGSPGVSIPRAEKPVYVRALLDHGFPVTAISRAMKMPGERARDISGVVTDPGIDWPRLLELLDNTDPGSTGVPVPDNEIPLYLHALYLCGFTVKPIARAMQLRDSEVQEALASERCRGRPHAA